MSKSTTVLYKDMDGIGKQVVDGSVVQTDGEWLYIIKNGSTVAVFNRLSVVGAVVSE